MNNTKVDIVRPIAAVVSNIQRTNQKLPQHLVYLQKTSYVDRQNSGLIAESRDVSASETDSDAHGSVTACVSEAVRESEFVPTSVPAVGEIASAALLSSETSDKSTYLNTQSQRLMS